MQTQWGMSWWKTHTELLSAHQILRSNISPVFVTPSPWPRPVQETSCVCACMSFDVKVIVTEAYVCVCTVAVIRQRSHAGQHFKKKKKKKDFCVFLGAAVERRFWKWMFVLRGYSSHCGRGGVGSTEFKELTSSSTGGMTKSWWPHPSQSLSIVSLHTPECHKFKSVTFHSHDWMCHVFFFLSIKHPSKTPPKSQPRAAVAAEYSQRFRGT